MNKLSKVLTLAIFSAASLVSNVSADSSIFAGPYVGAKLSIAGVEMDGAYNDPDQEVHSKDSGQTGMIGQFGSLEAGWSLVGSGAAFVTVGTVYTPTGDASFAAKDIGGGKNVTFELSDLMEVFIEPSIAVTDSTAVFIHAGYSEGELSVKGTDVQNQTKSLEGTTISGGLKLVTDNNIFIKAEAGMTTYDNFKVTSITGVNGNTTANATADTEVAFGALTVGLQF